MPIALAASIAAIVIVGALVVTVLTQRPSADEGAAVQACESAYADSGRDAGIVAGEVYTSDEAESLSALIEQQSLAAPEGLTTPEPGTVTVVWWLDSQEHLACTVEVADGTADASSAALVELSGA